MADGNIVYQGDAIGSAAYFSRISTDRWRFACPSKYNPADFYMKLLSVKYPMEQADIDKVTYLREKHD